MGAPEYVSLHTHTHNSLLDGFSTTQEYVQRAVELKLPGLGASDHGNTFGTYDFIKSCRDAGLTPVPGCEFYVAPISDRGMFLKEPVFYGNPSQRREDVSSRGAYLHLTVWAYNNTGLTNLFKLSTISNAPERFYQKPRIDFDLLADHAEGLVVSTGCPSSEISTRFRLGQHDKAYEYAGRLKEVFGDKLFMEIMDHNMSISLERELMPLQMEMAKKMGLPLLATNDSHYALKENAKAHEEMLCSQSGALMSDKTSDEGGPRFAFNGDQYYLKSSEEMASLFPERDFPGALSNSLLIAEMASDINMTYNPHLKPKPIIPEGFEDEVAYYKHLLNDGFRWRYGNASDEIKARVKKQIHHEMNVIYSSDFIGYMLTVTDYLKFTREKYSTRNEAGDIVALSLGVGRGSVGGSIHAYLLGISEIDPIEHDLIFERFLSAGRGATYRITYDDETSEDIIVSDEKQVLTETGEKKNRYIHQLSVGDTVLDESGADDGNISGGTENNNEGSGK